VIRRRDLVKANGLWRYVYRAADQHGQVIDVLLSTRRDAAAGTAVLHPGPTDAEGDAERGHH
jgi:transposase-like protein